MSTAKTDNPAAPRGFDSPVVSRQDDHLNRWPLAREIVGIATTGPKAWSVRVGIYGEWGTGKTSVLRFVDSMASQSGHIVIWFDPWEYSNKAELWQAFVLSVYRTLEAKLGQVPGADDARFKSELGAMKKVIGTVLGAFDAGKAINAGLDLLKKHFAFSPEDLASLQSILGDRRVIVLIDDLDRTAPELVPEILFALKELMDIPAFSFICAFDPIVVGEVLGEYHRGFGDGLKFLDKIIDYPRWLPPATTDGLTELALSETRRSCEFVPESAVRDAIPSLPPNPRTVRQFIRLLALLKPQIQRHHDYELHWSAIMGAAILKIRQPRIAYELLNAPTFWESIGVIGLALRGENEEEKTREAILEHINKTCQRVGISLEKTAQAEVEAAIFALASKVNLFTGLHGESISYQFNIAEAPAAVTWKEYDAFLQQWEANPATATINAWIGTHASQVQRPEDDAYREILRATVQRYAELLRRADNVLVEADKATLIKQAESLLALLQSLVFELGGIHHAVKRISSVELEAIVDKFGSLAGAAMPVHTQFWPRNEAFILKLFDQWAPDVMPLIRIVRPYTGYRLRNFDGPATSELRKKLCAAVLPHFARQVLESFRQDGFIERISARDEDTVEQGGVLWDPNSPIWTSLRTETLKLLSEAAPNRAVQENAYELLHWYVVQREGHAHGDLSKMQALLSDQSVFDAIWNAAIATPLAPRAVYQLRHLPKMVEQLKIKCEPPAWWQQIAATFIVPAPVALPPNAPGTIPPEEETE